MANGAGLDHFGDYGGGGGNPWSASGAPFVQGEAMPQAPGFGAVPPPHHGFHAGSPNILPGGAGGGVNGSAAAPVNFQAQKGGPAPGFGDFGASASDAKRIASVVGLYVEKGSDGNWGYSFSGGGIVGVVMKPRWGAVAINVAQGTPAWNAIYAKVLSGGMTKVDQPTMQKLQAQEAARKSSGAAPSAAAPSAAAPANTPQGASFLQALLGAGKAAAAGYTAGATPATPTYVPSGLDAPAMQQPAGSGSYLPWILGGAGVLFLGGVAYYLMKKD